MIEVLRDPLFIGGAILLSLYFGKYWPAIVGGVFIILSLVS